ncbi:MAG: DUF4374 domain-containing protein [Cyclobacteriaceae bacterium]|nr:DUF4374 domain-containing protein [Cyclobacteriaceae bacterium]
MKKQLLNRKSIMALALALLSAWSFTGCESDDPEPNSEPIVEVDFAISTVSGAWPDQTTYIQGVESLDFTSLGNDNAIELTGSAKTVSYNGSVYATPFGAPANLVKYSMNADGVPEEDERIVVPGANTFSTLYFESETVAYGTVAGGISKLIVFDPSTMRITDEINLSKVTSRVPGATRTYYLDMIERDDKLFMGVHYENNFMPVNDSAYVAVIDLTANAVEKVIADDRTGMIFGGETGPCMVQASNGDIYVNALGTTNAGGNSPSGVLRIKNGDTDFDQNYFFDLESAVGNICYGIYHTANGLTFTKKVEDESDFWEYATGQPQFKYFKIDLASKTSDGVVEGLPTSYKRSMIVKSYDESTLLFTTSTNDENAVYAYEINTGDVSKKFTSTGGYITGLEKLD